LRYAIDDDELSDNTQIIDKEEVFEEVLVDNQGTVDF
jgi:hypothetical protein